MNEKPKIKWLASYPKSGNTFVRLVLDATIEQKLNINDIRHSLSVSLKGRWHTLPTETYGPEEQLLIGAMGIFAIRDLFPTFLVKTHHANAMSEGTCFIPRLLTDRVLYVVRDPRDVVISFASHFHISIDQAIDILNNPNFVATAVRSGGICYFVSSWEFHVHTYMHTDHFPVHVVKYENLLADPQKYFTAAFEFLGLEFTQDELAKGIELADFSRCQQQEAEYGFRENVENQQTFFNRGTASHWREILTPDQVSKIVLNNSDIMAKLGYPLK